MHTNGIFPFNCPWYLENIFWILLERIISKWSKLYFGLLCKQIDIDNQFFCADCENIIVRTWVPNKHGVKLKPWNRLSQNKKSLLHYQCHIVIQLQRVDKSLIFWGKTWTSLQWWAWLPISCGTREYNGPLYQRQKIKHTFNIQKVV